MGRHFDKLVELVNKGHVDESWSPPAFREFYPYLCAAMEEAALFDFPILSEDILPQIGKSPQEYAEYLRNYVGQSRQQGDLVLAPFPVTAVEDSDSVVIYESITANRCRIIRSMEMGGRDDTSLDGTFIEFGETELLSIEDDSSMKVLSHPIYYGVVDRKGRTRIKRAPLDQQELQEIGRDLTQSTMAVMKQIMYIMDPENFILRSESNQSKAIARGRKKPKNRGCKKQKKTAVRPHFTIHSQRDLTRILTGERRNNETPLHPVRGHWRRVGEPNIQGEKEWRLISQYWRGEGRIDGRHGMDYEVFLKTGFGNLTPASEYKSKS